MDLPITALQVYIEHSYHAHAIGNKKCPTHARTHASVLTWLSFNVAYSMMEFACPNPDDPDYSIYFCVKEGTSINLNFGRQIGFRYQNINIKKSLDPLKWFCCDTTLIICMPTTQVIRWQMLESSRW